MTHVVVFDSDGNPIDRVDVDAPDAAAAIGAIVLQHYALVDDTPAADEPFLTITLEFEPAPYARWAAALVADHRNGYHVIPNAVCSLCKARP
jgi:hypothetical protein